MKNLLLAFLFAAISTMPLYSQNDDPKTMAVPDGKALVYVCRPEMVGSSIGMIVTINGEPMGATKGRTYVYKVVDPGDYSVNWKVSSDIPEPVKFTAEAGKRYYVFQNVKTGTWHAECTFSMYTEKEGVDALKKCKLGKLEDF